MSDQLQLLKEVELSTCCLKARTNSARHQGLTLKRSSSDPLIARQDDEPGLADDRQPLRILCPFRYQTAGSPWPGHIAANILKRLRHADAVFIEEPARRMGCGGHLVAQAACAASPYCRSNSTAVTTSSIDME